MGGLKATNVPPLFLCLPTESGMTSDFVTLKSNLCWPSHSQHTPHCILAPSLSFPACISLQTAAVSMVYVTIAQAVGGCARVAHVPQVSAAASATSPQGSVGPVSRPRTAMRTPAVLAKGAPPGEGLCMSVTSVTCRFAQPLASLRDLLEAPHSPIPRCQCLDGFEGDGFSCTPSNPCSRPERGGCSENVSLLAPSLKS